MRGAKQAKKWLRLPQKLLNLSSPWKRLQCQNQNTSVFLLITIQTNKCCNTDYLLELPLWQLKTVSGPCLLAVCRGLIQFGLLCLIYLAFPSYCNSFMLFESQTLQNAHCGLSILISLFLFSSFGSQDCNPEHHKSK